MNVANFYLLPEVIYIYISVQIEKFQSYQYLLYEGNFVSYNVLQGEYIVRVLLWGRQEKINFVRNDYIDIYIIQIVYNIPGRQNQSSRNYYVDPERNCRFLRRNKN